jgi:RNA polymerase sporulation-specific sigma factor
MNHYEIEACVIRAKNGSKVELLKILEQYKPFIIKTAGSYNIRNYDAYDLLQIGYVTLINAVAKYRTGSNTFSTYAFNSIKNAFKLTARGNNKYVSDLSLNVSVDGGEEAGTEFIDFVQDSEDFEEDIINKEGMLELKSAVAKLPTDEMDFVIMVYYGGASIKTYAEKNGLSYNQAVRKKNRILEKLRKYIKKSLCDSAREP